MTMRALAVAASFTLFATPAFAQATASEPAQHFQVPAREQDELVAIVESTKADIVVRSQ
ncbi:MAG: hypothetical protein HY704_11930 [Gemmatimonadetes bacterium]|nr:hypothetical protein [Gemmatimonadota bacterium]